MHDQSEAKVKQQLFLSLYEPVHGQFARFCQARTYGGFEARELISETVLRVYENFHQLRDHNAFLSFLIGTAANILRSKWRRKKFRGLFSWTESSERYPDQQNPELSADVRLLYEALRKLPQEQQDAVILFEVSGFSLKEIQQIQGVSLSAVKSRIVRGKKKLAMLLHDQETLRLLNDEARAEDSFSRTPDTPLMGSIL